MDLIGGGDFDLLYGPRSRKPIRRRKIKARRVREPSAYEEYKQFVLSAKTGYAAAKTGYGVAKSGVEKARAYWRERQNIYRLPKDGFGSKVKGLFSRKKGLYE